MSGARLEVNIVSGGRRRTLVVERNPLRLAGSFDVVECHCAVVAVDSSQDGSVGGEVLFLLDGSLRWRVGRTASCRCALPLVVACLDVYVLPRTGCHSPVFLYKLVTADYVTCRLTR